MLPHVILLARNNCNLRLVTLSLQVELGELKVLLVAIIAHSAEANVGDNWLIVVFS